jgi:hypothetical protein
VHGDSTTCYEKGTWDGYVRHLQELNLPASRMMNANLEAIRWADAALVML